MIRPFRRVVRGFALPASLLAVLVLACASASAARASTVFGYAKSRSWSGYVAQGKKSFDRVSGSWRVPAASCERSRTETSSSDWVGLGGWTGRNEVEQIGTETDCIPPLPGVRSTAFATAWWEIYPGPQQLLDRSPSPGDYMEASVSVRGHAVTTKLVDQTSHWSFVKTAHPAAVALSSAEWIVEDPTAACDAGTCPLQPFANFSTVKISHASARSTAGRSGSISSRAWFTLRVGLVRGRPPLLLSWPSALNAVGSAFMVSRTHMRPPPEPAPPV